MEFLYRTQSVTSQKADKGITLTEVTSSQDVPGFVSNALLMPFINEVRTDERR